MTNVARAVLGAMAGLAAATAVAVPAIVTDWSIFDDTVKSLDPLSTVAVQWRGLAANLTTEGSPLGANATHSLSISFDVSNRLFVTLGLGQSSGVDEAACFAA